MRTNVVTHKGFLRLAVLLAVALLGGCGADTPPYGELPLRDALSAAPEVLASLPEQARHDVAVRLEEAHRAAVEETAFASADIPTVTALVSNADARREENGSDAIVLGAIEPLAEGFEFHTVAAQDASEGPVSGLVLKGQPAAATEPLESTALQGRAGVIVADLAKRSGAEQLVRITGLPAGVVAMNRTLYVNGSWLVALSALETGDRQLPSLPAGAPAFEAPPREPVSVRINPYNLPASILECAFDVRDVCTCAASGLCDHERTDPTFANAQQECEWVNADPKRAEALCVLALMSIDAIRECVQSAGSACTQLPIGNRDDALAFVSDASCVDIMDICLRGGPKSSSSTSSTSGGSSSSSGGSSCSSCSSCEKCNQDTSDCNQNCAKCNENCSDCNQNCSDCNQNRKDCGNTCKKSELAAGSAQCRLDARRRAWTNENPSAPLPIGTVLWVLAPAAYIRRRIRRRA